MVGELGRVELRFGPHAELIAAVVGAAAHYAEHSGLNASRQDDLTSAAEQACRETLSLLAGSEAILRVTMEGFADRIEITFEYRGKPLPAAQVDRLANAAAKDERAPGGSGQLGRVDRVRHDTRGDESFLTLITYLGKKPAGK